MSLPCATGAPNTAIVASPMCLSIVLHSMHADDSFAMPSPGPAAT
jgi:hypothetical protein